MRCHIMDIRTWRPDADNDSEGIMQGADLLHTHVLPGYGSKIEWTHGNIIHF